MSVLPFVQSHYFYYFPSFISQGVISSDYLQENPGSVVVKVSVLN